MYLCFSFSRIEGKMDVSECIQLLLSLTLKEQGSSTVHLDSAKMTTNSVLIKR